MDPYTIRAARASDLETLVRQRRGMWQNMGVSDRTSLDEADRGFRAWARPRLRRAELVAFLIETSRKEIVAGGAIWLLRIHPRPGYPRGGRQPYLLNFYTEPEHRGRGLATRLAQHCIDWCRARGYPRITLHASDEGAPIYAKLGFVRTNEMRLELETVRRSPSRSRLPKNKI